MEIATKLAAMPTRTLALIRQQVREVLQGSFAASLASELNLQEAAMNTDDFREGVAAFKEKRKPHFTKSREPAPAK